MKLPAAAAAIYRGGLRSPYFDIALRSLVVLTGFSVLAACSAVRSCPETSFAFTHQPSAYYGPGQYFSVCPTDGEPIRCHHYHRHWVCAKEGTLFWDRNLESAARSACDCPPLPGTLPAAPAVSQNPDQRVF
jgi:hypothetical protein